MNIVIYSTTTCPYCQDLKEYLKSRNLPFTEKLVDIDEEARREMEVESEGFLGVPYVVINKEGGEKEEIIGFDKRKIESVLG